jgi:Fe-S oxidoreductase
MKVPPPEYLSTALRYDDPAYSDPQSLERELRRVGEICHQCRRCLPLCPAFPKLFELVDATDREIAGVAMVGFEAVNELCFHCKLCYNHCPYTPDEHEWDVDFPKLMRRHQLFRAKRDGIPWQRRLTTQTDRIGRVGSLVPGLMNLANRNPLSRLAMEKTLGIHRDWVQPRYERETVVRWARGHTPRGSGANGHVVLFATCSVNYSDVEVARAAAEVFERSDVQVDVVYERCCGMPFTDTGELDKARAHAERNVADLLPYVERGAGIVVPGPSCSLLFKTEYPALLDSDAARRVAGVTYDLMESLLLLGRAQKLNRDFGRPLGTVAYHAPCHLRAQNVGFPAERLLRAAGAEVVLVDACSGVDGTWGMQSRFHQSSLGVARKMIERIRDAGADHVATDCPLSALRIHEALGIQARHPVVLLRDAYGERAP